MRLLELTVRNYRPFRDQPPFTFSDQFTVIAGINGRGKTALLDGIALALSRLLPQISPAQGGYRYVDHQDIHSGEEGGAFSLKLNCGGIPLTYQVQFQQGVRRLDAMDLSKPIRTEIRNRYGSDPTRSDDAAPLAVYYTTDRAGFRRPKKLPREVPRGQTAAYYGALANRTVNYRDFMARFRAYVELQGEQRSENRYFIGASAVEAIQRAVAVFLEGFSDLRVESNPLRLIVNKGNVPLDLRQLSDGERSFLAMITDLSRRLVLANPRMQNPLEGEGVVLIDELELHLHPKWQREVADKLRRTFPKIQFICTTHSPFIIQSLRPGELITLDPEEFPVEYADKSIEDITENVMGVEQPQKSERYHQMMGAAEAYFRLLREPQADAEAIAASKQRLNELAAPFSDDAAFQALLKLERETETAGGGYATSG